MCEAFVAGIVTVVDSVADVRRVDALAARQTVERTVDGAATRSAGPACSVVRTAASAATGASAAASESHRWSVVSWRSEPSCFCQRTNAPDG